MFCIAKSEYVTPFFGRIAHLLLGTKTEHNTPGGVYYKRHVVNNPPIARIGEG